MDIQRRRPHEISSQGEVDELCAAIRAERDDPIVVFTSAPGDDRPAIDPGPLLAVANQGVRIAFVRNGPLTYRLAERLPPALDVYGGAARIYRPGVSDRSDPDDHPLQFDDSKGIRGTPAKDRLAETFLRPPTKWSGPTEDQRLLLRTRERDEARERAEAAAAELRDVRGELASERGRREDAERRARAGRPPAATERGLVEHPADLQLRIAVLVAWHERYNRRADRPLAHWLIGERLIDDLHRLQPAMRERVADAISRIVAGDEDRSHALRVGAGGADPDRVRSDGARAYRASVQINAPGAVRIHYWKRNDGLIEVVWVGRHDHFDIPER